MSNQFAGRLANATGLSPSAEPLRVSSLRASIPSAAPTLEERNANFTPPPFDMRGGKLGETPILWQLRMAYPWDEHFADEEPDWDQCCTCWVFATSEAEARRTVWDTFKYPGCVMPEAIASCYPERFRNQRDDEIDTRLASGMSAGTAKTPQAVEGESRQPGCEAGRPAPISTTLNQEGKA